jgi:hypothetical protein
MLVSTGMLLRQLWVLQTKPPVPTAAGCVGFLFLRHSTPALRSVLASSAQTLVKSSLAEGTASRAFSLRGGHASAVMHAALIQQLLVRFLGALWGSAVHLLLARNLQRRLTTAELVFL